MTIYRSDETCGDPIFFHTGGKFDPRHSTSPTEEQGWYFSDETWAHYHGPYESYGLCEMAIERYVKECL